MDHPGWKKGGTVSRGTGQSLLLTNNGSYDSYSGAWTFRCLSNHPIHECMISPTYGDVFIPQPISRRNQPMLACNWIVVSSISGPSPNPVKHTSEELAIEEAKRLALKNPSAQFYVYELKRAYQVETVKEIEVGDTPF